MISKLCVSVQAADHALAIGMAPCSLLSWAHVNELLRVIRMRGACAVCPMRGSCPAPVVKREQEKVVAQEEGEQQVSRSSWAAAGDGSG